MRRSIYALTVRQLDVDGPKRSLIVNADAALQLSHCCHWRIAQHFDQLEPSSAEKV
jgi:hypothetical protein